ncbi:MAG TPA: acyl carrier protein [Gammaproteobacteria bacterium]|nr:acyl carrier protein [Gammaproteobacteria bacterium]
MAIEAQLRNFILKNYLFTDDESFLDDNDSFLEKGIIDSTGIMEVILFLEQEFGVRVEDEDMVPENLDSVSRIAAFVRRKKAAA